MGKLFWLGLYQITTLKQACQSVSSTKNDAVRGRRASLRCVYRKLRLFDLHPVAEVDAERLELSSDHIQARLAASEAEPKLAMSLLSELADANDFA